MTQPTTANTCPGCRTAIGALGRYCHACEEYVADLAEPAGADDRETPAVADDRSEATVRMAVRAALELHGFVVIDFEQGYRRDGSTRVRKGLPDLYIMGHGVGVWRELKTAKGRLTQEQEAFGEECRRLGIDWGVWRHEDEATRWAEAVKRGTAA